MLTQRRPRAKADWTAEQDALIRDHYPRGPFHLKIKVLLKVLRKSGPVSERALRRRAKELGAANDRRWTPAEDAALLNRGSRTQKDVAAQLGRTTLAVQMRGRKMNGWRKETG